VTVEALPPNTDLQPQVPPEPIPPTKAEDLTVRNQKTRRFTVTTSQAHAFV
jgi:hypothetical protein